MKDNIGIKVMMMQVKEGRMEDKGAAINRQPLLLSQGVEYFETNSKPAIKYGRYLLERLFAKVQEKNKRSSYEKDIFKLLS